MYYIEWNFVEFHDGIFRVILNFSYFEEPDCIIEIWVIWSTETSLHLCSICFFKISWKQDSSGTLVGDKADHFSLLYLTSINFEKI
jgi:hypothetical protein